MHNVIKLRKMKPQHIAAREHLLLNYKIWLSTITGDGLIDESTWKLLKAIRSEESISKAAKIAGISYRKAWGDLKKTEELLGYNVVNKKRGGLGHPFFTNPAKELLHEKNARRN